MICCIVVRFVPSRDMDRASLPLLDRVAVGLSGLCVVHCVASIVVVSVLSSAGTFLTSPAIHEFGLAGAVLLGAFALWQGYSAHRRRRPAMVGVVGLTLMACGLIVPHGWAEVVATVAGVSVLAGAHLMNARARA